MEKDNLLAGFVYTFFVLILLQSPLVFALDCNSVSPANHESCIEILKSNITNSDKELLISNLEYNNKFFPDHEYIFNRNTDLVIDNSPAGVQIYNNEFIKSAWISIFAIMPSILYNNTLYVPENTSILTGFSYNWEIPQNYYSSNYPKTSQGDCKRIYSLTENDAKNNIYINDKYFGEGDFIDIVIKKDSNIKAEYNINLFVKIDHYNWNKYCSSRRSDGSCKRYSYKCKYDYTEIKNENLKISDTLDVKMYNNNLYAYAEPTDYYEGNTRLKLNYSDSIEINFNNSEYDYHKYLYSINYSKPPYYVYTLKADNYNQEKIINLFKEGNNIIIKDTNNCNIKAFDFFNVIQKKCYSDSQNINFFIKTDKLKYSKGEEIKVNIFPNNISAKINYGDNILNAKGEAIFTAEPYINKITAEYNGLRAEKIIYISDAQKLIILWNLIVFTFLNYLLFILLKKYHKNIL